MNEDKINYKAIFDQMPVARFLLSVENGVYVVEKLNIKASEFFNKKEKNIIGVALSELVSDSSYSVFKESLDVAHEKKIPVTVPALPEFMGQMRTFGFWINPVLDEEGSLKWIDVIGQPGAMDLAVIQRERDDALSLLTAIFDASEIAIFVSDKDRKVIKVNDSLQRIYGWTPSDVMGKDFVSFLTRDEHNVAKQEYKKTLDTGSRRSGEAKTFRKDGTIANVIYTTATLKLSHGRQFQVTTIYDITDRKQMELSLLVSKEQADAANNAKSAFLANMSHELRTPLNAIIGFSEMMLNETFGPLGNEKYGEYLSDVCMSAKHLLDIINEVLDMSKIEAGKIELDEQKIDLNTLSANLVRVMRSRALNDETKIIEDYDESVPKLFADARLIRQVLINLVTNSIKYSVHGGNITVRTHLNQKNEIEIMVKDEGVGIPEDRLKDALEPFGQIHDPHTSDKAYQGTGLGLPLAKAMVEMHGGVFQIQSQEGKGTIVDISFSASRTRSE